MTDNANKQDASNSQRGALDAALKVMRQPNPELPRVGVACPTGDDIDWKKEWFKLAAARNHDVALMLKELKELHEEWAQDLMDAAGLSGPAERAVEKHIFALHVREMLELVSHYPDEQPLLLGAAGEEALNVGDLRHILEGIGAQSDATEDDV